MFQQTCTRSLNLSSQTLKSLHMMSKHILKHLKSNPPHIQAFEVQASEFSSIENPTLQGKHEKMTGISD